MLTVTEPTESHRLTTVAALKAELKVTSGADDAFISDLIDEAGDAVRRWCGRTFALETVAETFRLIRPDDSLLLARWPVVDVVSITESRTTLATTDFETDKERGVVYRLNGTDNRSWWSASKIVVTYQTGYILPGRPGRTLPEDVERAAILLVKSAWFARTRDPLIRSEDINGVTNTTYWVGGFGNGATFPPDVEGLLSKYRQPAVG